MDRSGVLSAVQLKGTTFSNHHLLPLQTGETLAECAKREVAEEVRREMFRKCIFY